MNSLLKSISITIVTYFGLKYCNSIYQKLVKSNVNYRENKNNENKNNENEDNENEKPKLLDRDVSSIIASFINPVYYKISPRFKSIDKNTLCFVYHESILYHLNINNVIDTFNKCTLLLDLDCYKVLMVNPFLKKFIYDISDSISLLNKINKDIFFCYCPYTDILEKHINIIDFPSICCSPLKNVIDFLEHNINYINLNDLYWDDLSANPLAINILRNNIGKIDWCTICYNVNAGELLLENQHMLDDPIWEIISASQTNLNLLRNNIEKLDWVELSNNVAAIPILSENINLIDWHQLSSKPEAIDLIRNNLDKVDWNTLSLNSSAVDILSNNLDRINWEFLSMNSNAIDILKNNMDKVSFSSLLQNKNLNSILEFYSVIPSLYKIDLKRAIIKNPVLYSDLIFTPDDDKNKNNYNLINNVVHNKISFNKK
jgi:hypothetical protein